MDWQDNGILISCRPHGETSVIAEVFTRDHGRHAGVIRGGISRKLKPMLQPGAQLSVHWSARLEAHLGSFRVELDRSRAVNIMQSRLTLEAANAAFALMAMCLPEREPNSYFYDLTLGLLDRIDPGTGWMTEYVRWEAALLADVGFGLDLSACAGTGQSEDLVYVSPKSGRAVSAGAGAPYADRLLRLPGFLVSSGDAGPGDLRDGLVLTGHFLKESVLPSLGREDLPDARHRLLDLLA